jgi:hypothetical protein
MCGGFGLLSFVVLLLEGFAMARITFSPLIAGASGKAADAVFSKWKSTPYVRKHVIPANPQSPAQTLMRDAMGRMAYMWRKFASQVQAAQNLYATNIGMSGFNWFAGQNAVYEKTFLAQNITPPDASVEPPLTLALTDSHGGVCKVDWTGGLTGALIYVTIWSRKVTAAAEALFFDQESFETVLASAGTANVNIAASNTSRICLAIWNKNTSRYSVSLSNTIVMGA